jgi:hypothetical protein
MSAEEGREMRLPEVEEVMVSTVASLVNLAGIRLTEEEHKDPAKAKAAIDAARELVPFCPDEALGPIRDALSQVQMLYVRETGGAPAEQAPPAEGGEDPREAEERAKARSKIWTPPGA